MSLTRYSGSVRSMIYCAALLVFTASILVIIGKNGGSRSVSAQNGPVLEAEFPGTGTGAIPDGDCDGTGLVISFAVTGITAPVTDVRISFTGTHTWVGDLDVLLRGPGNVPVHEVFTFVNPAGTGTGDSSNLNGTYNFLDTTSNNWWAAAASGDSAFTIPPGDYRTASPTAVNTSIIPTFTPVANPNGTWTLKVNDCVAVDTGSITAATLTVTGSGPATPTPKDALADFDGDGKTDPTVIRAAPGASGQAAWWTLRSGTGGPAYTVTNWGIASDTFIPADFDGDLKDDVALWRPGAQATFWIIRSSNSTVRIEDWGTTGDDPTVVGDYNGDYKDDVAIYRPGAAAGDISYWWWKLDGGSYTVYPWGSGIDYPAPGDYDGDNRVDYAIQRPNGAVADIWILNSNTTTVTVTQFGTPSNFVVPGDYDDDNKTDLAIIGTQGPHWLWTYRPSSGGPDVSMLWGDVATDLFAPGDYNGDEKSDFAVWRFGAQSNFWAKSPDGTGLVIFDWGSTDDEPVTKSFVY